jgi:hypothetical protein
MSFITKNLAKEALSEYPCSVHICVNPYYWQLGNSICGLGDFKPTDVDKLAEILDEVSAQICAETGFYPTSLDWLDIFPEDESLLNARIKKANEDFATLLDSLQSDLIEESER